MAQISNIKLPDSNDYGIRAGAIPYGEVDATSTATAFTATVPGIKELVDGTTVLLRNGQITSASGFTLNVNGLGAKPCYNNMATGNDRADPPTVATRDTTIFNVAYTMLFVYSTIVTDGGGWICYRGYNSDNNTIGYQLRTNNGALTVTDTARYYKLYFTSANNTQWVPASVNSTNNSTAARAVNQRPINPFGRIVYTSASTNYTAGSILAATTAWSQYALVLGYSFNRTGAALTLTSKKPVYVKCAPQSDGSAIMDANTPCVQDLPTTDDGKIYIYLGIAYDATHIELCEEHPVYYHKDGAIRLWSNMPTSSAAVTSVNTKTGDVVLTASDVGALPSTTVIPTKTSDLTNDSGFTTNTGTVTSIGITNGGGLSISGSPVTTSGSITVGHSNSITAEITSAVYPITYDSNGHITGAGSPLEAIAEEDIDDIFDLAYDVSQTTWVFDSTISPKVPQSNYDRYWNMNFYCDGQPFTDIRVHTYTTSQLGVTTWTFEIWYVGQSMQIPVYTGPGGWIQNQYKTITITSENIKGEIYAFLCENAVQEGGE